MPSNDLLRPDVASYVLLSEIGLALFLTLFVLLTVLLSPAAHRSAVSVNLYICLVFYCVAYLILPIFGEWTYVKPPLWLCILSAMGHYGSLPLCAAAIFGMSAALWLSIYKVFAPSTRAIINCALLITPWLIWAMMCLETWMVGVRNQDTVGRHDGDPFCSFTGRALTVTTHALLFVFLVPGLILQGSIVYRILTLSQSLPRDFELKSAMRESIIRVSIITCGSISIALALAFDTRRIPEVIILGAFPLISIFILGTKKEIFTSWIQWARGEPSSSQPNVISHPFAGSSQFNKEP